MCHISNSISYILQIGGDTVSTALAATLFYLSHNVESYERLKSEIRTNFSTIDSICQGTAFSRCHYLRACLDEAMRLSPPAPGCFWRETTGPGAFIDGVFVPPNYDVGVGIYALHHNPLYFSDPYAFRPERFLLVETSEQRRCTISPNSPSRSMPTSLASPHEMSSSNNAQGALPDIGSSFAPFLLGPRTCPARRLAYLEMCHLIARIMWSLDFRVMGYYMQGESGVSRGKESEFQLWDIFSADKRGPLLQFKKRED
jgi:cytochrome P450